jgi:hypothetical protein
MTIPGANLHYGGDAVTLANLPDDLSVYWGYINGPYANYAHLQNLYPTATVFSITIDKTADADEIDCENGDATVGDAAIWAAQREYPRIYIEASKVATFIALMGARRRLRNTYMIRSAHWTAQHICSPDVCGYPQTDATQWTTHGNTWDESVVTDRYITFGEAPVIVTPPPAPIVVPPHIQNEERNLEMFIASSDSGKTQWLMFPNRTRVLISGSGSLDALHSVYGDYVEIDTQVMDVWSV